MLLQLECIKCCLWRCCCVAHPEHTYVTFPAPACLPAYAPIAGPAPAWVVGLVQLMGKTLGDGFAAKGCLRNKDPLLCPQGALARWLISRFTCEGEPMPDPTTEEWRETMLWPSPNETTQPISYANHKTRLKDLFKKLDIIINKVTHAPRIFAARYGEGAGLSDAVSTKLCHGSC